ncbi:hypothetical protein LguiA_003724 [Lonicera macranthoides]
MSKNSNLSLADIPLQPKPCTSKNNKDLEGRLPRRIQNDESSTSCDSRKGRERSVRLNSNNKSISDSTVPITSPTSKNKSNSKSKSKSKSKVSASVSPGDSAWFSSEDEKETESLFSTSTSFDSSLETINESPGYENRININKNKSIKKKKKKSGNLKVQRLQRYVSNSWKTTSLESESNKVKESFVVVKKSEDPYDDFKRSMLEMILEKQMFEAKDLEELLQCFLSLNSRQHHAVIVQAFTEIWEDLFL